MKNEKKSLGVAYLLWLVLGPIGGHRFYMGRTTSAVLLILCTLSALVRLGLSMIVTGIWLVIDAFRIPSMVRTHNEKLITRLR